jgi:hypothetical protein
MRIIQFQTNFSVGELDPLIRARTDLQQYQNALEEATNVIIQPQGGFKRRDGLKFIHDFGATYTDFKVIPFEFSVDDSYLLVLVNQRIYIFKAGVLQTNINGSGDDYLAATDITTAILDEINYTQAVDTLILCHEDLQTKRLVRNTDTSWTIENLPITNLPQYPYAFDTHMPDFTITPSATTGNITITASAATTETGSAQGGAGNTVSTIILKAASSYTDDQPNGMFITFTAGPGAGQTRHVEDFVASTKILTFYPDLANPVNGTTSYKIEPFAPAAVGEYAQVTSTFGRARYVEYVSSTAMKSVVEVPFFDTGAILAGEWESEHGYEDVWSTTRGWPKSAAFHEGRLYFGGSKSRPNTVWGSGVINYFDFNVGTGLDDESVEATINTNQLNSIVNLFSGNDFRIFTTGGEFVVLQSSNDPITPANFFVRPQTRLGSKAGIPVEDLNGASVFIQRQGKSLNAFQYGDTTASYQIQNISALSSHLLKGPIDMAARRAASTDESDRLFVVNGDDGTMAVYSILVGQNVIAPSRFSTDGSFVAVAVEVADVYVIVKRIINGVTKYMLEKFDSDLTLDSAKTGGAASSVNMTQLQGETVQIVRDGVVEAEQVVPASPYTITFATAATSSYEVGLNYTVTARTMPAEPVLASGSVQGFKKRIVQVDAIVNNTQAMTINNKQVSFRAFGEDVLDTAVVPFTGIKTVHGLLGYSGTGQITITQTVPLKMIVLGLEYRLSVGN